MSAPELSRRLGEWLDPLAGRHLIVAHDYAVDAQFFMGVVPDEHRGSLVAVDVRRAMSDEALAEYFEGPSVLRHHALHDARALRHACASWKESMPQDIDRVQRELALAQVREQLAFWRTRWPALGDLHAAQAISQNMLCGVIECARSAVARS